MTVVASARLAGQGYKVGGRTELGSEETIVGGVTAVTIVLENSEGSESISRRPIPITLYINKKKNCPNPGRAALRENSQPVYFGGTLG